MIYTHLCLHNCPEVLMSLPLSSFSFSFQCNKYAVNIYSHNEKRNHEINNAVSFKSPEFSARKTVYCICIGRKLIVLLKACMWIIHTINS